MFVFGKEELIIWDLYQFRGWGIYWDCTSIMGISGISLHLSRILIKPHFPPLIARITFLLNWKYCLWLNELLRLRRVLVEHLLNCGNSYLFSLLNRNKWLQLRTKILPSLGRNPVRFSLRIHRHIAAANPTK